MMTSDPQLIKNILIKDIKSFGHLMPPYIPEPDHPVYRHVLDIADDDNNQRMRAVFRTLFTDKKLRLMAKKIDKTLIRLTNALDNELFGQSSASASVSVVDIKQMFINQSIDLIGNVMFSLKQQYNTFNDNPNPNNTNYNKITQLIKRLFIRSKYHILAQLVLPKFMLRVLNMTSLISADDLNKFTDLTVSELTKRLNIKTISTDTYDDFLQWLLNRCPEFMDKSVDKPVDKSVDKSVDNETDETLSSLSDMSKTMSKQEVVANMFSLFSASYDSYYLTMTFIIYELAINPDCQQRVYDEIITCFRDNNTDSQSTTIDGQLFDWETLGKLEYLEACISETLRLHSILNREVRIARHDYTDETTGVTIKKDQMIQFSRSAVQLCPDYYRMPDQFIPDRFLKQNKHQLIDSTYLPFGLGRRMCPAYKFAPMALKLNTAHLLARYRFLPIDGQTVFKTDPIFEHYAYCPEKLVLKIEKRKV
ncbi:cytochrome P450 3A7-like [Oppia nitens]|uniref:cytochrome P450 3A7-like n=1 Tax=Oppia nitens TaxID=1686743 RepID=UPI0023DA1C09|nr:cytochrome P450 3A7-like [Oppia nitens]